MKRYIAGFLVLVLILSTLGCISGKPPERKAGVRMGHLGGVATMDYYAIYNGYYEAEGLNVTWINFRGGSSIIEAAIAGEVDGGAFGSIPALIRAASRGVPLKIVAVGTLETKEKPGDVLVVLKDSGIESIEDLRGKIIAVHRFGTTLDLTLRAALKQHGIDPTRDVTITQVKVTQMIPTLKNGQVDAAFVFPDFVPYLEDEGRVILTLADVFSRGYPISVVFFREEFIEEHPEEVKKFVRAYLKGIKWADEDPERIVDVEVAYTDVTRDIAAKIPILTMNPSGKIDPEAFEEIINLVKEYTPETLEKDITTGDIVDYRFLPE
ncbi:MAG: ABC transporter substrate-binding protein [Candidatus Hydrothermarchaeales archaeon]